MCSGTVGAAPSHPTETLSPPCVHRSKRASSTSRSGSGHVGAERCLHPTLPRGQQTCPRAEEGGGDTGQSLWALLGEAAKARLRGEEFEGLQPLPVSLSQMLLFPVLPARGMPCRSHVPPASPADVWDPGRKPSRKHLPAPRLSTRPRPPPTRVRTPRSSALLPEPGFAMTVLGNTGVRRTVLRDTSRRRERVPRLGAAACLPARSGRSPGDLPRESLLLYRGKFGPFPSLERSS